MIQLGVVDISFDVIPKVDFFGFWFESHHVLL